MIDSKNVVVRPGAAEGDSILVLAPSVTSKATPWRPVTPEELRHITRDLPEVVAMATGDVAEARAALARERASYETALAACERERDALAGKVAALEALRGALGDASGKLDAALATL